MNIQLVAHGVTWSGWQQLSLKKSLGQVQQSFEMTTTDRHQQGLDKWNIFGGTFIKLYLDGRNIFEGYVQNYKTNISSSSRSISISGESRAVDLVQCSHVGPYFWKSVPAEQVIEDLIKPFNYSFLIDDPLMPIPEEGLRMAVDASPYDTIKKIAEQNGLLVFTDDYGNLRIAKDIPQVEYSMLTTGDYTSISAEHDISTTFSKLIVKAQENSYEKDKFDEKQRKEVIADNDNLVRYRPKVIISDGDSEKQENLTTYINRRLTGDGVKVSLTVKSPYDKNGNLWGVGQRVWLKEPAVNVDQELIISDLTFSVSDSSGFEAKMDLQVPETFSITPATPITIRRSKGWFEGIMEVFK